MDHRIRLRLRHDDTVSQWVEADFDPKWKEVFVRFDPFNDLIHQPSTYLQVEIVRPPFDKQIQQLFHKQQLTTEVTE